MGQLTGKTAIVTGGTKGIGKAVAERFVREGARLVLVSRNGELGERVAGKLDPNCVAFLAADVRHPETAAEAVRLACERFGAVDILVNNAGIDHTGYLPDIPPSEVEDVIQVNFIGSWLMLQAVSKEMMGRGGVVVNVASRLALIGVPTMTLYAASKGAVVSMTRGAAVELAPYGIRVNAVAPGLTATPLAQAWFNEQQDPESFAAAKAKTIPQGRFAEPEEVAAAILFLASEESSHVTGAVLPVDGGYTAA